ncbi:MAG TPA: energy transducer TonB [Thermoanaerobaculia bacterium]|jgi:TonB family protein|nr:energy transducer TonB [Thermoanaerobaculia bacterium]
MSRSRIAALVTTVVGVLTLMAFLATSSLHLLGTAEAGDKPMKVGGEVKRPKPVSTPAPANPGKAQGRAFIECVIDEHGLVTEEKVVKSSGNQNLDRSAVDAVKTWTFLPATLKGKPVTVSYVVTVDFTIG